MQWLQRQRRRTGLHTGTDISLLACIESVCYEFTPFSFDVMQCPSRSGSIGGTVGYGLLILLAVTVVFYVVWRAEPAKVTKTSAFSVVKAWSAQDRPSASYSYNLKILLSYFQVSTSLLKLVEIPYVCPFSLRSFRLLSLNPALRWMVVQMAVQLSTVFASAYL